MKLATLSYSKIVIDEIQSYNAELLAYIIYGLRTIVDVGGKFAILTATLPPFILDALNEELGKISEENGREKSVNIPNVKYNSFIEGKDRHNVKAIENEEINADDIYSHYKKKRGKTLVICNTVKKAQELYSKLKEKVNEEKDFKEVELELLHAKFIKRDRLRKENDIVEFGRTENKGNKIWITTSLVEASLDVDFDYLFTELNDLSGFFQRLGRVNRKGTKKIDETNAYVYLNINENLITGEDRSKGFIDKTIYETSKEALKGFNGIISEKKKFELINENLTSEKLRNSNFVNDFEDKKENLRNLRKGVLTKKDVIKEFRNIISFKAIPRAVYEKNKEKINEIISEYNLADNEEEREKARIEMNSYTLSLRVYEILKDKKNILKIGNEIIYIANGEYSEEVGFQRNKKRLMDQIINIVDV